MDKLRGSDERALMMIENAPVAVVLHNKDMTTIDCNKRAVDLFGFNNKKELTTDFYAGQPELQPNGNNTKKIVWDCFDQAIESGYAFLPVFYFYRKDGSVLMVEVTFVRAFYGGQPAVIEYNRDITNEMQRDELMKVYVETSPIPCVIYNEDYSPLVVNDATLRLLGLTGKEQYIKKFWEFCPEFQPCGLRTTEKFYLMMRKGFEGTFEPFEWHFKSAEAGEVIPVEITVQRMKITIGPVMAVFARDLRVEKARLMSEEKNKAKTKFLARMSHEIRTPITAVLGISEIYLNRGGMQPAMEEAFLKIHSSSKLLLRIVDDMLDLSKIESGQMVLNQEEYEIGSLIHNASHAKVLHFSEKEVGLTLHVDENLPRQLIGDMRRIEQILYNLLTNAFKYTDVGEVELIFNSTPINDEEIELSITVRDTGIGMTKHQMDKIGSEFTRLHENEKHMIEGVGLGMPIVFNLLHLMNANISMQSEVGVGTSITVTIPQKLNNPTVLGKEFVEKLQLFETVKGNFEKRFKIKPDPMPYGRVLVVDDLDANIYVAVGLLRFYKLQVDTCISGYEAIERVEMGHVYDIIFMDHMMPGMDGVEAMEKLRALGYTHPIVVLTANVMMGQAERFTQLGFDGFVSKPIQTEYLNACLVKFIKNKQPPEVLEQAALLMNDDTTEELADFQDSEPLIRKIRADFGKNHRNDVQIISQALQDSDMKTAEIKAHSLKSIARLMHENKLAKVAEEVERVLREGDVLSAELFAGMKIEFERVLEAIRAENAATTVIPEIKYNIDENTYHKALAALDKIKPLLEQRDGECIKFLDSLRPIREAALFIMLVEKLQFPTALKTADLLRNILEEKVGADLFRFILEDKWK